MSGENITDQSAYKFQMAYVFTPDNQTFIDVLRDAPLLAGFKETISSGISPLRVKLPRSFDFYDQAGVVGSRGTIAQGNVVRYYLFGPTLPQSGLLRYQGFIDTVEPEINDRGEESVTITLVPFSSVLGDHGITQDVEFGTSSTSSTYIDPLKMFKYFFDTTDPVTGKSFMYPLTWDSNNPTSSGNTAHYKFSNQPMQAIFDTFLLMLPANWYYRINADLSFSIRVVNSNPDHTLYVGKNISNPQYRMDWSNLKNVVVYKGGNQNGKVKGKANGSIDSGGSINNGSINNGSFSGSGNGSGSTDGGNLGMHSTGRCDLTTGSVDVDGNASVNVGVNVNVNVSGGISGDVNGEPRGSVTADVTVTSVPMQIVKTGSSVNTFGERIVYKNESRIIDQNTLNVVALGLLTQLNRYTIRTKVRIPDISGNYGMGYPIDSMKVGDAVLIVDPTAPNSQMATYWDQAKWDQDYWDFRLGVSLKTSLFDHVLPIVAIDYGFDYIDIELDSLMPNLSKSLHKIQQELLDFTMGIAATGNAVASA